MNSESEEGSLIRAGFLTQIQHPHCWYHPQHVKDVFGGVYFQSKSKMQKWTYVMKKLEYISLQVIYSTRLNLPSILGFLPVSSTLLQKEDTEMYNNRAKCTHTYHNTSTIAYHCHLYISLQLQVLVITTIIFFLSQLTTQMSRVKLSWLRLSTKSYDAVK